MNTTSYKTELIFDGLEHGKLSSFLTPAIRHISYNLQKKQTPWGVNVFYVY